MKVTLVRTCRNPACGEAREVHLATPRCRQCGTEYGPFTFGLDHDPGEPTAPETEAERTARFRREQETWLKQQQAARQTVVTSPTDDSDEDRKQGEHP